MKLPELSERDWHFGAWLTAAVGAVVVAVAAPDATGVNAAFALVYLGLALSNLR